MGMLKDTPACLNSIVIDGIRATAADDKSQTTLPGYKDRRYTANYGIGDRPQGRATSQIRLRQLIGTRQNYIRTKDGYTNPTSMDRRVAAVYHSNYLPVFFQHHWRSFDKKTDGWYDKRFTKVGKISKWKKPRTFRISLKRSLKQRNVFKMPYLRLESCPELPRARRRANTNRRAVQKMAAAQFETWSRTVAEMLLLHVFGTLPRVINSFIASDNYEKMFMIFDPHNPAKNIARPLPKGSLGIELEKPLHDDKNGLESFGVWRCLADDPNNKVNLIFKTTRLSWSIQSSKNRFAIFNGSVPHKAKAVDEIKPSANKRVHHTCYTKPLHEYISLHLCSDEHRGNLEFFSK